MLLWVSARGANLRCAIAHRGISTFPDAELPESVPAMRLRLSPRSSLSHQAGYGLSFDDGRRVPPAGERLRPGTVKAHCEVEGPFGAGSQFTSLSAPGLSFWKYRSREPSGLYLNGIQLLSAKRLRLFAT